MKRLLEQANTAIKKGKLEATLGLLLNAWRSKRSPELADLIDSVSEACSARLEPLPPRLAIDDFDAWRELCWERKPEDFERLIAVKLPRNSSRVGSMVGAFYLWRDDPRVARFCAGLLRDQALFSTGRDADRRTNTQADIYGSIARHLVKLRDSRSADALTSMSFAPRDFPWVKAREAEAFGRVAVRLTVSERKLVRQLSAAFPPRFARAPGRTETKALLAQIYERPGDLSARAVYADALSEEGDPRGEFITLQLSSTRNLQREAALLRKHEARWAGPVARWFEPVGRVFEGGFFVGGKLTDRFENSTHTGAVPINRGLVEPSWRLVTTIEFPLGADVEILAHPNLAGVKQVEFDHRALVQLSGRKWPFTSLTISYWFSEEGEAVPFLKRCEDFPHLKELGFDSVFSDSADTLLGWLPRAPVLNRLARLSLQLYQAPVAPWLVALKTTRVPELHVLSRLGWTFAFTRDSAGGFSRLRCRRPPSRKKDLDSELFAVLDELPANALTQFQLEGSTLMNEDLRQRLNRTLTRFKKLSRADLRS